LQKQKKMHLYCYTPYKINLITKNEIRFFLFCRNHSSLELRIISSKKTLKYNHFSRFVVFLRQMKRPQEKNQTGVGSIEGEGEFIHEPPAQFLGCCFLGS